MADQKRYQASAVNPLTYGMFLSAALALAACAAPATFSPTAVDSVRYAAGYSVLYRFTGGDAGAHPSALVYENDSGALYGSALGATAGVVFRVTPSGDERVLYRFGGGADGDAPSGELAIAGGILYGSTVFGGSPGCFENLGCGTIYSLDVRTGKHTILYRFPGGRGGAHPSGVTLFHGALYGTTQWGGRRPLCVVQCGTVFRVSTSGQGGLLYAFKGNKDLWQPLASLLAVDGVLYGTASRGGCAKHRCGGGVFSVTTAGTERVIYAFADKIVTADGLYPDSTLAADHGELFGTTPFGGSIASLPCGCGTVFRMDQSGKERVIHRFAGNDGQFPTSVLTRLNGAFYGVTPQGGGTSCLQGKGCGTVFSTSPEGTESVAYRFRGHRDGWHPSARLVAIGTRLFGTTSNGGGNGCEAHNGCGTIFALKAL